MVMDEGSPVFYRWRQMSDAEREALLAERRQRQHPWHNPPHFNSDSGLYLVTAACFGNRPIIGYSSTRMERFSVELIETCRSAVYLVYAWIVLPNHYHVLLHCPDAKMMIATFGRMHGRTSHQWNGEEQSRGRQVWFNAIETGMKSERHFWASLIYVMNNAVKHGYVKRWQDWPFSNASDWLKSVGRDEAVRIWKEFPIDDFGKEWDPPDL